jgi:uncharacterized membrane protein
MLMRLVVCPAFVASALLATSSASFAQFQVCNKTSADKIDVAIGLYHDSSGWVSKGWYEIARDACTTLVDKMSDRYYYLYPESGDTVWDGDDEAGSSNSCVHPDNKFTLSVAELANGGDNPDYEKHGYATKRFTRVDTEKYSDYTFNYEN